MPTVIHQFDQPFSRVKRRLPHLAGLGFSHVLVSPPQRSHPDRRWWGRYQPVDFREVAGPLGTAPDLAALCAAAGRRGMRVLADAVLNHMTNHPAFVTMRGGRVVASRLPRFGPQDFYPPGARPPVAGGPPLPQLRTDTAWVRGEVRAYLRGLRGLGVAGFRLDAAKHLDPGLLAAIAADHPDALVFGEMVYGAASHFEAARLRAIRAYDFPLAAAISAAFGWGGDLRGLIDPRSRDAALPDEKAMTFVNGHDLARRRAAFAAFRLADHRDRELAHVYLLGRPGGIPVVYYTDLRSRLVKAALRFRARVRGTDSALVYADAGVLVWRRGTRALAAVNKGGRAWVGDGVATGLRPGVYRDLARGGAIGCGAGGVFGGLRVPARGAVLLVRAG